MTLAIGKDVSTNSVTIGTNETVRLSGLGSREGSLDGSEAFITLTSGDLVLVQKPLAGATAVDPSHFVASGPATVMVHWWRDYKPDASADPPYTAFATL